MIKTAQSQSNISLALAADFITDTHPLREYAGFEPGSQYYGQARQTFSLVLSSSSLSNIRGSVKGLYDQLLAACWPTNQILPFDMVRFDAFLDPLDDSLKIIELNTRNVGLHEIVEWLDNITGQKLGTLPAQSLNKNFVANQKLIHASQFGDDVPLLYMSRPMIPKWLYYDELCAAYSSVESVTSPDDYTVTPLGIQLGKTTYTAVTRKFAWSTEPEIERRSRERLISVLQPLWMRHFGHKDYLPEFNSPAILSSEIFNSRDIEQYMVRKNELVLKIINAGGSKSVYLGASYDEQQWRSFLQAASACPELWVLQQYYPPPEHDVLVHGHGPSRVPIQLGIFVLPCPGSPREFTMDIVVKAYGGAERHFTFDPSGLNPDIWFGNVIEQGAD